MKKLRNNEVLIRRLNEPDVLVIFPHKEEEPSDVLWSTYTDHIEEMVMTATHATQIFRLTKELIVRYSLTKEEYQDEN